MGSWNIIEISAPRIWRIVFPVAGSVAMSTVSWSRCRSIDPASMRPGGVGISRMMESAVTLLPHPLSPTTPTTCVFAMSKRDAVDRTYHAVVRVKVGPQVTDFKE